AHSPADRRVVACGVAVFAARGSPTRTPNASRPSRGREDPQSCRVVSCRVVSCRVRLASSRAAATLALASREGVAGWLVERPADRLARRGCLNQTRRGWPGIIDREWVAGQRAARLSRKRVNSLNSPAPCDHLQAEPECSPDAGADADVDVDVDLSACLVRPTARDPSNGSDDCRRGCRCYRTPDDRPDDANHLV
ncbi:unnamed protein product, partial [Protopolystoma xenopodis]